MVGTLSIKRKHALLYRWKGEVREGFLIFEELKLKFLFLKLEKKSMLV